MTFLDVRPTRPPPPPLEIPSDSNIAWIIFLAMVVGALGALLLHTWLDERRWR